MATQQILFTVFPRAMAVDTPTLPVSVFVSPRLSGATKLDAFPDWLDWTAELAAHGLTFSIDCADKTQLLEIDRTPLRPELWRALFTRETPVIPYEFDDYTDRAIMSYPAREALSVLKSAYQKAGIDLALPDRTPEHDTEHDPREFDPLEARLARSEQRRNILRGLIDGLAINWEERTGESWRERMRHLAPGKLLFGSRPAILARPLDLRALSADGTFVLPAGDAAAQNMRNDVARRFAVCSHMPQGDALKDRPQDFDERIDFHTALSCLNSYPELLRALGLVFDLELPVEFVATTSAPGAWETLAISDVPGRTWAISTNLPATKTAYLHWHLDQPAFRLFTAAPAVLRDGSQPLDVFGLLTLDPRRHGVAQVDIESGLHKATLLAESLQPGRAQPAPSDRPDVFDETATLPSLRSGGFSLYADGRALRLASSFERQQKVNATITGAQQGDGKQGDDKLFAEDLTQGHRLDVWDAATGKWHSLHRRHAEYDVNGQHFEPEEPGEGFAQLAAAQPSPGAPESSMKDLYLNESMARWNGWSLSVPFPSLALSADPAPGKALDDDLLKRQNEAATSFRVGTTFKAVSGSLPPLRFGRRYRFRFRAVDLAGNSLQCDDPVANTLALAAALPREAEGMPYLRFEPVDAPNVVLRDATALTGPGSQLDRLVIRTFNADPTKDASAAVLDASDRHIVPPSASVEMGERLGMFDLNGKPDGSAAMYALIVARDKGGLHEEKLIVAGKEQSFLIVADTSIDTLPYLPDALSRGAAFRDLPGAAPFAVAHAAPGVGADAALTYEPLADANPRRGSATIIDFGSSDDWQQRQPLRLALADGDAAPHWNPAERVLTVSLPKGTSAFVPMSSWLRVEDLKLMGVWQWLREEIDRRTSAAGANGVAELPIANARTDDELIAHVLQRAQEGGHWMLTPPRLLTLVHAVQQPLGEPSFTAINVQHEPYGSPGDERTDAEPNVLQTSSEAPPMQRNELAAITAWRQPESTDAFLLGGLRIHAASTDRVEILADWIDPIDDPAIRRTGSGATQRYSVVADEISLKTFGEGYVIATQNTPAFRAVSFYDAPHDLLCMVRAGDRLGSVPSGVRILTDAAPRHRLGDTRHHRIRYTARVTSRFREYFDAKAELDFTRTSEAVLVEVPASARPAPPRIDYVVPTFGWQRQSSSNVKRSIRFGGGVRIYLERPWFSSGEGELLGVTLFTSSMATSDLSTLSTWKAQVTQWGADPIWESSPSAHLHDAPSQLNLLNAVARELEVSLPAPVPKPGRVNVAGYDVQFDEDRQKWFADIVIDTGTLAYMPFVRLVLVRYQPCAVSDAKLSAPVVADFIQLTPERSAMVSADPYHARTLRIVVSGPAPAAPAPKVTLRSTSVPDRPTLVSITVQTHDDTIGTDLGWRDLSDLAIIEPDATPPGDVLRWSGRVTFKALPEANRCRLLIREYEYLSANWTEDKVTEHHVRVREAPHRLIYAESVMIDAALIGAPATSETRVG